MSTAVLNRAPAGGSAPGDPIVAGGRGAMRRVSMRGLRAHKMRFVLTLLAVMLGTAFISGSFVLTRSLGNGINALVGGIVQDTDVVVNASDSNPTGLPLSFGNRLRALPEVAAAEPETSGPVTLVGSNGKAVTSSSSPPTGLAWTEGADNATTGFHLLSGRRPTAPNEVAINDQGLAKSGLKVGDVARIGLPATGLTKVKVVGSYKFDFSSGGFVGVAFTPSAARTYFAPDRHTGTYYVRGKDGVSQTALRDAVQRVLPLGATAQTQEQFLDDAGKQINGGLSFLNTFLLVFGMIGLLVGASLIYITFSMVIAQRLRELALLRAVGASRGQILRSVLMEGLVVGLVGSLVGLLLGWALGWVLLTMLGYFLGVPMGAAVLPLVGSLVTLGLGTAVTVASAVAPAVRAGATSPVEAMGGQFATPRIGKLRIAAAVLMTLLAVALTVAGTAAGSLPLLGFGVVVALPTILVVSPLLAPWVMAVFRPLTRRSPVGRLAHGNTIRNPKRTAATAAALALGLALISAAAIVASSTKATLTDAFSKGQNWNYVVRNSQQQTPLPAYIVKQVRSAAGSGSVLAVGAVQLPLRNLGTDTSLSVSGDVAKAMSPSMVAGTADLRPDTMLVTDSVADAHHWKVGTKVNIGGAGRGPSHTLTVAGILQSGGPLDPMVVSSQVGDEYQQAKYRHPSTLYVTAPAGQSAEDLRSALDKATAGNPLVVVQSRHEFVKSATSFVNVILGILYGLLALAVVVSILGIVNTLALSVVERVRELGMMRAIGAHRLQIWIMVTIESVMICVYGALIGLGLGITFGFLLMGQLADTGLTTRVIPWVQIASFFVAAVVVGLLAAVWPSFKASRVQPLEAIAQG